MNKACVCELCLINFTKILVIPKGVFLSASISVVIDHMRSQCKQVAFSGNAQSLDLKAELEHSCFSPEFLLFLAIGFEKNLTGDTFNAQI